MNQLRRLQLVQLYILKKIKEICDENDLKYYLIGGTLLGAIRHKGFIPWDDDIDIVMYRKDLEFLEKIIKEKYNDEFFVQNFCTDPFYTRYITKIRLNGTVQEESNNIKMNINKGIYIDIFPLDYVKHNKGIGMYLRGRLLRILFALKTVKHVKRRNKSTWKKWIITVIKIPVFLIPDHMLNLLFKMVCERDNKNKCQYTTNFASHFGWEKQTYLNEVYGEGELAQFENSFFRIPAKSEVILRSIYGTDFMKLPPLEKRNSGHTLVQIDFGNYGNTMEMEIK